jgi:hypothetical protein
MRRAATKKERVPRRVSKARKELLEASAKAHCFVRELAMARVGAGGAMPSAETLVKWYFEALGFESYMDALKVQLSTYDPDARPPSEPVQ